MAQFVTFDYAAWVAQYPMFSTIPQDIVQGYWDMAGTLYLRNDGSGPVSNPATQRMLLNLLTCHLAALISGVNGQAPSGLVGRVSSASEGSVSVSTEYPTSPNNAWFLQTPWGALYWQATANMRNMRYLPGPTRFGSGRNVGGPLGGRRF